MLYILTEKNGIMKCSIRGLFRPESKNLTLMEPGNLNRFFIITDLEKNLIVSALPIKIIKPRENPYIFLWTLKIIKNLKLIETPKFIFFVLKNINYYIGQGKNFSFWFLFHISRELGYEIDLDGCINCGRKLKKFAYFSKEGLYCSFCRKSSYEKINEKELKKAKKIKNLVKIPDELPNFLKIIIKNNMLKLNQ